MDLVERADVLFQAYTGDVPGASFAVIRDGEPLIKKSYGLAEVSKKIPVKAYTNFRLASLTKAFTAMCVLKLIERGEISFDDRLSDLIPSLPKYANKISVRHMLGHTSGLGDYENDVPGDLPGQVHEDYVVEKVKSMNSTYFPPGSRFLYSDTAYVLLAVIVESVSGVPFPRFVESEIFKPLGMVGSTLYGGEGSKIEHRAFGYTKIVDGYALNDQSKTSATYGDGCLYSSIEDLLKWNQALYSEKLLGKELLKAAFTPGRLSDGSKTEYGFGWFITSKGGRKILHHAGSTAGFQHKFIRVPEEKLALIILTNRDTYDLTIERTTTEGEDSVKLLEYFNLIP
jgi:CubicO group peptidase (beta-lactamase class C family)